MLRIFPFVALMPPADLAREVACPPYDVLSKDEAKAIASQSQHSFVSVIRPEVAPTIVEPYSDSAYQAAKQNLDTAIQHGSLQTQEAGIYLYRQVSEGHAQTGIVCCYDVEQYREGKIKKHEKTRPDKEDDRVRHMMACSAHPEPVLLTFKSNPTIDGLMDQDAAESACFDFVAEDGVQHIGWRVADSNAYAEAFEQVTAGYIADGHHRTAAADRSAAQWTAENPSAADAECNRVLSVFFPIRQLRILAYNRVAKFPEGMSWETFVGDLLDVATIEPASDPVPNKRGMVCVFGNGSWLRVRFKPELVPNDTIGALDVSLLQEKILSPILGIEDPRTHQGIQFVGGSRGTEPLEQMVKAGEGDVAFSMCPTSIEDLVQVSDDGDVMPPKSTWFDPKLLSGLFVHPF